MGLFLLRWWPGRLVAARLAPGRSGPLPAIAAVDLFLFGMCFNLPQDPGMLYFETEPLCLLRAQAVSERVLAPRAEGSNFLNAMIPTATCPWAWPSGGDAMYPRRYRQFAEFVESRQQGSR